MKESANFFYHLEDATRESHVRSYMKIPMASRRQPIRDCRQLDRRRKDLRVNYGIGFVWFRNLSTSLDR